MSEFPPTAASKAIQQQTKAQVVIHFLESYERWRNKFNAVDFSRPYDLLVSDQSYLSLMNLFWNMQFDQYLFFLDGTIETAWMRRWFVGRKHDWHFGPLHLESIISELAEKRDPGKLVESALVLTGGDGNPFSMLESYVAEYSKYSFEKDLPASKPHELIRYQHENFRAILSVCNGLEQLATQKEDLIDNRDLLVSTLNEIRKAFIRTELWKRSWRIYKEERLHHMGEAFDSFVTRMELAVLSSHKDAIRNSLSTELITHSVISQPH
ncbi:MAG: hypothetical protein KF824_06800 [Fimbriimonadaceae bacterium]|nr:MAG: hypothetical protein KF824_06800 [Fimbriimonadaceae bacterium]